MCGVFLGFCIRCTYLTGGNVFLRGLDPNFSPELCVRNWCGQKEGKKVKKTKWLCMLPNKEKDRDRLLWTLLEPGYVLDFFPLSYPSASVQLFEFQSRSLQCLCSLFPSQYQLIILQFVC